MSVCIQMQNPEGKRMCVYSERDFDYMKGKGWTKYEPPVPAPDPVPVVAARLAPATEPKKRGRKPKAK